MGLPAVRLRVVLVAVLALGTVLVALAVGLASRGAGGQPFQPPVGASELERAAAVEQLRKLRIENERLASPWTRAVEALPFVTAAVGVAALLATLGKQSTDLAAQRAELAEQRDRELHQRAEDGLAGALGNLGAQRREVRVAGAATLQRFLDPVYRGRYDETVLAITVANLAVTRDRVAAGILVRTFETVARRHTVASYDLAGTYLAGVDLHGLDFGGRVVDLAFAKLYDADLQGCRLHRLRGYGAQMARARLSDAWLEEARLNEIQADGASFARARLVSATFKGASLARANFAGALLQSAHFERADLTGATFWGANLDDTYFTDAVLYGRRTLESIVHCRNWDNAWFDPDVRDALEFLHAELVGRGAQLPPRTPHPSRFQPT